MKHDKQPSSVACIRFVRATVATDYGSVDWSATNSAIARLRGVTREAVRTARQRYAPDSQPVRSKKARTPSAKRALGILWMLEAEKLTTSRARELCGCSTIEEFDRYRLKLFGEVLKTLSSDKNQNQPSKS